MNLDLEYVIELCRLEVENSNNHDLTSTTRSILYRSVRQNQNYKYASFRANLGVFTATYVIEIFESSLDSRLPRRLLNLSHRIVSGTLHKHSPRVELYLGRAYTTFGSFFGLAEEEIAPGVWLAGYSCYKCCLEAIGHDTLSSIAVNKNNKIAFTEEGDSAAAASRAYAYQHRNKMSMKKMREFWLWWIDDAIVQSL